MRPQHWLYTIPLRLRSLFRRRYLEQEFDEELQFHLERKIEEGIANRFSHGSPGLSEVCAVRDINVSAVGTHLWWPRIRRRTI